MRICLSADRYFRDSKNSKGQRGSKSCQQGWPRATGRTGCYARTARIQIRTYALPPPPDASISERSLALA